MKTTLLKTLFIALFALVCSSCEKDIEMTTNFPLLTFSASGGEKSGTVESNVVWDYSCDADWVDIERDGITLTVVVEPNTTGENRNSMLKIEGNSTSASQMVTLSITQD